MKHVRLRRSCVAAWIDVMLGARHPHSDVSTNRARAVFEMARCSLNLVVAIPTGFEGMPADAEQVEAEPGETAYPVTSSSGPGWQR